MQGGSLSVELVFSVFSQRKFLRGRCAKKFHLVVGHSVVIITLTFSFCRTQCIYEQSS